MGSPTLGAAPCGAAAIPVGNEAAGSTFIVGAGAIPPGTYPGLGVEIAMTGAGAGGPGAGACICGGGWAAPVGMRSAIFGGGLKASSPAASPSVFTHFFLSGSHTI